MKTLYLLALVILVTVSGYSRADGEVENFWQRTKKAVKRGAKGVKQGGKEVGRATQEIFDPNDEDLQAERKAKGQPAKVKTGN